jgi:hypothetical protein
MGSVFQRRGQSIMQGSCVNSRARIWSIQKGCSSIWTALIKLKAILLWRTNL